MSAHWLESFTLAETHPDRSAWVEFMTQARAFLRVMERTIPEGQNRDEALMRFAKAVMVAHGAFVAREKGST